MATAPFNYGYLRNCRAYVGQRFSPRGGILKIAPGFFSAAPVHSIRTLTDQIAGVNPNIYGVGTELFLGVTNPSIDAGYSGNPLALVPYRPEQSPQSWMYIADSLKMRKVRSDGLVQSMGIEPPLAAPTVGFGPDVFQDIYNFSVLGAWTNAGTASAITPNVPRISTTIGAIVYDSGTTGFASVAPSVAIASNYGKGMLINVGAGGTLETALVQDVLGGFLTMNISSIAYDSGGSGLCTIQPVSATVAARNRGFPGPLPGPPPPATRQPFTYAAKLRGGVPVRSSPLPGPAPPATVTPTTLAVGLQPNGLVRLNGGGPNDEYVRILSVTVGKNGQASFRCSTVNHHNVGEPLIGVPSVRTFLNFNHAIGETLDDRQFSFSVASGQGWIQILSPFNLTVAPPNPIQETDEIHLSILIDQPQFLTEARISFDVDATTNDFNHNYFYMVLRQNDTQQAVSGNQTALATRTASVTKVVMDDLANFSGSTIRIGPTTKFLGQSTSGHPTSGAQHARVFAPGGSFPISKQANTGFSQWTEFRFKVKDLVRVGGDLSRNLANVAGIRIQLSVGAAVNVELGDLWIGGTYGPDIGTVGSPLFYRFRGRSTLTGAKSLGSPPTRSGIEPHNQRVVVTGAQHPNPSVNTIDVFRWGSTLLDWYYVGSAPNSPGGWTFNDDLSDTDIVVNSTIDHDVFQPFPSIDLPRRGVCTTVGTKVIQVSGDAFNPQWYPGSQININGIYYTIYSQPSGNTLEIVENAGTQNNVPFFLDQPTLLARPLYALWGPYAEGTASFFFACGDTNQPGVLFLTRGNDPDSAPDTLQEEITAPSEALMNGCMYKESSYVWSSDNFYRLYPNLGSTVTNPTVLDPSATQLFIPTKVSEHGLFSPWAFSVGERITYLGKDGIYQSVGSDSQSITDEALYLLFPHDGQEGEPVTVGGIIFLPPDMTVTAALRLSEIDQHVYFDYQDTLGTPRTLVYSNMTKVWGVDDYNRPIITHYGLEGKGNHGMILGGNDGNAYTDIGGDIDVDSPFPMEIRMPQLSELLGAYTIVEDGLLGLQGTQQANISLVVNVDGTDNLVQVPVSTSYVKKYTRVPPIKGKILAFGLVSTFPFTFFQRDCQFGIGEWGRSGSVTPTNPFSRLTRAMEPKVG